MLSSSIRHLPHCTFFKICHFVLFFVEAPRVRLEYRYLLIDLPTLVSSDDVRLICLTFGLILSSLVSGDLAPLDPVEVGDVLGADSEIDLLRLVPVVLTGVVVLKFDLSLTIFQM